MKLPSGYSTTDYGPSAAQKGWGAGWPTCSAINGNQMRKLTLSNGCVIAGGVHQNILELAGLVLNEITRRGHGFHAGWCWGAECRAISGTNRASNHSWGLAFDLDAPENPYTTTGQHNIPDWAYNLLRQYGFGLGADYSGRKDWMHAEFMGTPSDAAIMTGLARQQLGGGQPPQPPTTGDDMSAAELNTLIGKIDNLKNLLFQQGYDVGGHSVREEVGWATDKVIMPKLEGISAQISGISIPAPKAGTPDTYACVVDDETGAWYAVAPGQFWHIENMSEVGILRTAGVLVGESHLNHGDTNHLRVMVTRGVGDLLQPPPPATVTVAAGDTIDGFVKKYGGTRESWVATNKLASADSIQIGQVLTIPKS